MQRPLLRAFLALIGVNAAVAIGVIVQGDIDGAGGRVLLTSLLVTAGVIGALASSTALPTGSLGPALPWVGIVASLVAAALLIAGVWTSEDEPMPLWLGRSAGTAAVVAAGIGVAAVLALAALAPRYRRVQHAARFVLAYLVALIVSQIWFEWGSGATFGRAAGVGAVLLAALAVAIPALHRAAAREQVEELAYCPSCGAPLVGPADRPLTCTACGARYRVHVEHAAERATGAAA